jgi:hypothetical protein
MPGTQRLPTQGIGGEPAVGRLAHREVSALNGRQGLSFFPPLWSAEARQDLGATSRRAVSMAELLGLSRASCRQFDGTDPGFLGAL